MRKRIVLLFCAFFFLLPSHSNAQHPSPVEIYVFQGEDCPSCGGDLEGYLQGLKSMYPFVQIHSFDVADPSHEELLARFKRQFGWSGSELPAAFIGDQMLCGEQQILERLDLLIVEYQIRGAPFLSPPRDVRP